MKDGVALSDNSFINGSDTEVLTIDPVSPADAGSYTVVVSGSCDNSISNPAPLTVNKPTMIISQPVSQSLCKGESAILSVAASGTHLTFTWMKNGIQIIDIPGRITGSSTSNLSISLADSLDNGVYICRITGDGGTVSSNTATLNVRESTRLINQPASSMLRCAGENIWYTLSAPEITFLLPGRRTEVF